MRRLGSSVDLLVTTSAQFLLGAALLIGVSLLLEPWGAVRWSPSLLPGLLVLGVLGTGIAYVAWFWLFSRVALVRLGTILYLVPVTGVVVAILVGIDRRRSSWPAWRWSSPVSSSSPPMPAPVANDGNPPRRPVRNTVVPGLALTGH